MKKVTFILGLIISIFLTSCNQTSDNELKREAYINVNSMYQSVAYYCLAETCEEEEELTYNDLFTYIDSEYPDYMYDMDPTTVLAKYTEENIYIYLVPVGDNDYGYEGPFDPNETSKDDMIEYKD